MRQRFISAFKALQAMGVNVFENSDNQRDGNFSISAEGGHASDDIFVEYYGPQGWPVVDPRIEKILSDVNLFAEWVNPGLLTVYEI